MKKWMFLSLLLFVLLLTGCQGGNDDTAYDLRTDNGNPNFMSNQNDNDRQHQVDDDVTGRNPNFLDLRRVGTDGEANRNNIGSDIDKAKQIINRMEEFKAESVWINNDRMTVTVNQTNQNNHDVDRLHRKLVQALPRYNIEVRVR